MVTYKFDLDLFNDGPRFEFNACQKMIFYFDNRPTPILTA